MSETNNKPKSYIQLICNKFEKVKSYNTPKFNLTFMDQPDNCKLGYEGYNDNLSIAEYKSLLDIWLCFACELTDGPVFISFAPNWTYEIEDAIYKNKIKLIQRLYWHWTFGQNRKDRYVPSLRPIYWLNKGTIYPDNIKVPSARQIKYGDKRAKAGGRLPDNVWNFNRVCGTFKEKRKWHITQHPEALIKRIILGHSKEGDLVFDPFVGSGTTAYQAYENNRNFIGMDISEFYINKIKEEFLIKYGVDSSNIL